MLPDRNKVLTVVLGFGKARDHMLEMSHFWQVFSRDVILVSPQDDPVGQGAREVLAGNSSRFGPDNNRRIKAAFAAAAREDVSHVWIHEWDSLAVVLDEAMLPPAGGMTAYWRKSLKPLSRYRAPYFPWFPQLWTIEGVRRVSKALNALPDHAERGWPDRFLGAAMLDAKIPVKHQPRFFGEHTIEKFNRVVAARRAGAVWLHGIKSHNTLLGV